MLNTIESNPNSKLDILLQVHDEIDGEFDFCDLQLVVEEIKCASIIPIFINDIPLIIPIDIEIGSNWGDTVDYREYRDGSKR